MGLHADRNLDFGILIGEYTGILREDGPGVSADELALDDYRYDYPAVAEGQIVLTARHCGSLMRFANHSSTHANISFMILDGDDGWFHVVLVTTATVDKGEQLLVDYGPQYWHGRSFKPLEL